MLIETLGRIKSEFDSLNVNYEFSEWTSEISYPYFVGTYSESEVTTEDGMQDNTFTVDGFTRGKMLELEQKKEIIRSKFDGFNAITTSGCGFAMTYSNSFPVPTGDDELLRIQIVFKIKEWKV